MIDFLAVLVAPSFGAAGLARLIEFLVPSAQALVLALLGARITWTGIRHVSPDGGLAELFSETSGLIVRAVILLWVLFSWQYFAGLALAQGPELAARAIGSNVSPDQIAAKMLTMVVRYSDTGVFAVLDWLASSGREPTSGSSGETDEEFELLGFLGAVPTATDILLWAVAILVILVAYVVAAAAILFLAMPKLLLLVCLAIGPLAIAAMMSESQLAHEFVEGWGETTATAVLALPVMAILAAFMGSIQIPGPSLSALFGAPNRQAVEIVSRLVADVSVLIVILQLMFMVLPISSGLIQGRIPSAASFVSLIISICMLVIKPLRLLLFMRRGRAS